MSLTAKYVRSAARTAWGEVQTCRQLPGIKGIYEVATPGHGGYLVSDEQFELHPALRTERFKGDSWRSSLTGKDVIAFYEFEEDVAWALLMLYHPEALAALNRARVRDGQEPLERVYVAELVGRWYPELLDGAPA